MTLEIRIRDLESIFFPSSQQTVSERYQILKTYKTVFYESSILNLRDFHLSENELREENLKKNPLTKIANGISKKFDHSNFFYVLGKEPHYFIGGGVEKIIGGVPYEEGNPFYGDIKGVVESFGVPVLNKTEKNLKKGLFGDIYFLYTGGNKIGSIELGQGPIFLIFALPSQNYIQQPEIQELMKKNLKKLDKIK